MIKKCPTCGKELFKTGKKRHLKACVKIPDIVEVAAFVHQVGLKDASKKYGVSACFIKAQLKHYGIHDEIDMRGKIKRMPTKCEHCLMWILSDIEKHKKACVKCPPARDMVEMVNDGETMNSIAMRHGVSVRFVDNQVTRYKSLASSKHTDRCTKCTIRILPPLLVPSKFANMGIEQEGELCSFCAGTAHLYRVPVREKLDKDNGRAYAGILEPRTETRIKNDKNAGLTIRDLAVKYSISAQTVMQVIGV